jgi:hypothetical protein
MSLGSHQKSIGATQSWITPRQIVDCTGPFDLDPCASTPQPWPCARESYTEADDGLSKQWHGLVYLNPPFHRHQVGEWISRLAQHNHGVALLHMRCECEWFRPIWQHASAILCLASRIHFYYPDGSRAAANSGAPPCLIAFGDLAVERLQQSGLEGALVQNWRWQNGQGH